MNSLTNDMAMQNEYAKQFQDLYIALRETENRLCSDEELARLPDVDLKHMYYDEWLIRKTSLERFRKFLEHKTCDLNILEVGCGNGWLSHALSHIRQSQVTGIDINSIELQQARRVFAGRENLSFILGDIRSAGLTYGSFDIIVFAASIQYFENIADILNPAFDLLKSHGEIHIIDTKFYKQAEAVKARERSAVYFHSLGFEEMSRSYFHHSMNSLNNYNYQVMYDPNHLFNQILKRKDPFHWIMIKK